MSQGLQHNTSQQSAVDASDEGNEGIWIMSQGSQHNTSQQSADVPLPHTNTSQQSVADAFDEGSDEGENVALRQRSAEGEREDDAALLEAFRNSAPLPQNVYVLLENGSNWCFANTATYLLLYFLQPSVFRCIGGCHDKSCRTCRWNLMFQAVVLTSNSNTAPKTIKWPKPLPFRGQSCPVEFINFLFHNRITIDAIQTAQLRKNNRFFLLLF
jgi:hypothetical protein